MKSRRTVTHTGQRPGSGGKAKLWAYGYSDLAKLLGVSEGALRARVARRRKKGYTNELGSLEGVCRAWATACSERARRAGSVGGAPAEAVPGSTIVIMPTHGEGV